MQSARLPEPRFDYEYIHSLSDVDGEWIFLSYRAWSVINSLAEVALWDTRWDADGVLPDDLLALQWEVYNAMTTPIHFNEVVEQLTRIADAIEDIEASTDVSDSIDGIAGLLALLDPRLAVLISVLDSIDDVLGGVYEPS